MRRPLAMTLHATKPNDILHFDFLYMGNGGDGMKYLLVVQDDLSSYKGLCTCKSADSESVADYIQKWIRSSTIMNTWVSDQGSHFKNQVM